MKRIGLTLVVVTIVLVGIFMETHFSKSKAEDRDAFKYVVTETSYPSSLDPLDADNTNNMSAARMIYLTPIEISPDNKLVSRVLKSFSYNQETLILTWIVSDGLKFSDGSPIRPADVAFSIARMAYTRPKFPVIEHIVGLEQWVKQTKALETFPEGIVIEGNKITIRFSKNVTHPLFRFCLELFSIIPKSCVDPLSNKITCSEIPTSGYYRIAKKDNSVWSFDLADPTGLIHGAKVPKKLDFYFVPATDLPAMISQTDGSTIVAGNEWMYTAEELKILKTNLVVKFTPSARIGLFLINPTVGAFNSKECRQEFSQRFRTEFAALAKDEKSLESSAFTQILPGYMGPQDFKAASPVENSKCVNDLRKSPPSWGFVKGEHHTYFEKTLAKLYEGLGIPMPNPIIRDTRKELVDLFSEGKLSLMSASTGFWALDPAGDVQMLFTPNLHKILTFVSLDQGLQKLISDLGNKNDADDVKSQFVRINKHLYEEATFNVYVHISRFFAAKNIALLNDVPFAITAPAPWQVFRVP